ncbi:hypothetical protein ABGB17_14965 [Sphaerisporangium sp. B11E5]|uniref:hypothetical protein n=1 Tax=Sphaerisporangium sp. B11E5 TaxID=3153563 RepID=UPI00325C8EFA
MTTRNTKRAVSASVTALLAAALVAGTGPGAAAVPTGCTVQYSAAERWASSFCASGTGEHRVRVLQRHFLPEVGLIPIIGPWQSAGVVSYTTISAHTIVNVWAETR